MRSDTHRGDRWSWLTDDHTPWANQYVYWLKTPLGVLFVLALIALAMGVFVTPQGYVLMTTVVAIVVVGIAWPWIGLRGIDCKLTFRSIRCKEGQTADVVVEIVNRWPFPVWGLAIENGFFTDANQADSPAVALARIPGWSKCQFVWKFTPEERGIYPQVIPNVVTEFPFGLWKSRRFVEVNDSLTVWPKTFRLSNFPLPKGRQDALSETSDQRTGNEGERMGVRGYREGDSLRTIHWSLTARHGRFIVSERQHSAQSSARIYVDTQSKSHTCTGPNSSLAWSLRIAASLATELVQQHAHVVLDLGSCEVRMTPSPSSINQAMDQLARLQVEENAKRQSCRKSPCEWSVAIVTDKSTNPFPTQRTIELLTDGFSEEELAVPKQKPLEPWICVSNAEDVAREMLTQWSRKSREAWCGA